MPADENTDEPDVGDASYRPQPGFLTDPNDPTVGDGGVPYAGTGTTYLPEKQREIGFANRERFAKK